MSNAHDDLKKKAAAAAHFDRGVLLENGNDLKGARSAYEQAVDLDRYNLEALASIAWLDAQAGDGDSALDWAKRALGVDGQNVLARMAVARAELQGDQLDAASTRLANLYADPAVTGVNRSIVLGMIGDLNDGLGESARAFKAYEGANAALAALNPALTGSGDVTPLGHARRLAAWFGKVDAASWQRKPDTSSSMAADLKGHVFLVGFPRSGTTLLENVLAAHPDVVALEEKDSLAQAANAYLMSDEGLERLARIDAREAAEQRAAYWSTVRGFGVEPGGRLFIDKMPLATVLLPLVSKLFPDARVLFAIRDPRDVVFSCFRRRFGMNAATAHFLTLDSAAAYYDAVMRLSTIYRDLLPIPLDEVRYEALVNDFEDTTRSVCESIGLDWLPEMADFAVKARTRGIATPSAAQIARGLNREGQGSWKRYRQQLAPVLPVLEPWVRAFGYASA
jgi:tetratricopeptide (TPR) repeat protein